MNLMKVDGGGRCNIVDNTYNEDDPPYYDALIVRNVYIEILLGFIMWNVTKHLRCTC